MLLDLAPLEGNRAADFVVGKEALLHPIVDRAHPLVQPARHLRLGNKRFKRTDARDRLLCLIGIHYQRDSGCLSSAENHSPLQLLWRYKPRNLRYKPRDLDTF